MTSYPDTGAASPLTSAGMALSTLKVAVPTTGEASRRFWASSRRWMTSTHREVLEISFGGRRLINQLSLKVSRFPLTMQVQYRDRNGDWQAVAYAHSSPKRRHKPRREIARNPVRLSISESVPKRVDSARATSHPQHFGKAHWSTHSWKIIPANTDKIRFVFTRNAHGTPPVDPRGNRVPYSVAVKDLKIGYKVVGTEDLPPDSADVDWWASGEDILGSRLVYSTYTQPADSAIDGDTATYWRSEPQPFPFAVTNLFLDLRDEEGQVPVIDRFWMDPVTVGPVCNVYYSSDEPSGDFDGLSEEIPPQWVQTYGNPLIVREGADSVPVAVDLGPTTQTGVQVSNVHERMRFDQPWWAGLDAATLSDTTDTAWRPILTMGGVQIAKNGATIELISPGGQMASVDLDPARFRLNSDFRLVAAYFPYDPASQRQSYLRLVVAQEGYDPVVSEVAIPDLTDLPAPIRIGLHPDPDNGSIAALAVHGLVIKSESLSDDAQQWFLDEGADFVADPETPQTDRGTAQNARLRMHPMFVSATNPFGLVGGVGNRFDQMSWTPVTRDYALKRGYLHLPPTRAAYWKFEMTRLLPQVYENFVTIDREVLVFPPDVVANYEQATGQTEASLPDGMTAVANSTEMTYTDVLTAVTTAPDPVEATDVLVVKDPTLAQRAAETGWIWTYQPWHVGSSAPKFLGTQVHHYESLHVKHSTKVAFFAGIRELTPYRVDYTFADDTEEYVEHMLDTAFIDTLDGMEHFEGGIRALGPGASATSKALMSYRTVRGVQFATQESDAYQVLDDPDFVADNLKRWTPYGDAVLTRLGQNDVLISRGYVGYTWGHWEDSTYGDLEAFTYSDLEGFMPTGYAEGGIVSQSYHPSGTGEVLAIAEVSAGQNLNAPLRVEIVSAYTGQVVAFAEKYLQQGEKATIEATYSTTNLIVRRTYADVEHLDYVVSVEQQAPTTDTPQTYEMLEAYTYGEIEAATVQSDLYARVRQQGKTTDSFHVNRLGLYDSPIAWFFSNDNGVTWWQAVGVRNNPNGVLLFPAPPPDADVLPEQGRALLWRVEIYRDGAIVNALHIRPWYGDRSRTVEGAHTMEALGPNTSIYDNMPDTGDHPMWQDRTNFIEHIFTEPTLIPFWRNLAITPGGEGPSTDGFETSGGVVEVQQPGWTITTQQGVGA